jgi:hypothetical protein
MSRTQRVGQEDPLPANRPLTGPDIEMFRAWHKLNIRDMVYALGLQTLTSYKKLCVVQEPLAMSKEILLRLYVHTPGLPSMWRVPLPKEFFDSIYGEELAKMGGSLRAKQMLYARFAAMTGRSLFTSYRWLDHGGDPSADVARIISKVTEESAPAATLEKIAALALRLRGINFEHDFPMPADRRGQMQLNEPNRSRPRRGSKKTQSTR